MSNRTKTWFLVPGWNIPPEAIHLGGIIEEPTEPHLPILRSIPPTRLELPVDAAISTSTGVNSATYDSSTDVSPGSSNYHIDTDIYTTTKTDFSFSLRNSTSNKMGIFAQFLQVFGIGAEAGVDLTIDGVDDFKFESETEEWFVPSMAFVQSAVKQPWAQTFLQGSPRKTPLYVITGIRTVRGITARSSASKEKSVGGKVSIDATGTGVPINAGPVAQHIRGAGEEIKWNCKGPLVFAYQLARIKPNKAAWTVKSYKKGAFFGTDQKQEDVEIGLDDDFLEDLEFVDVREGVQDVDGSDCVVVVPPKDQ
ncbi:hypothetical protein KCU98_g1171, partial [Aureobasidium melanogenum]